MHMRKTLEDTRVVLIDGCPVVRFGLRSMISAEGARVVGETGSVEDTLLIVEESRPDFVIMDPDLGPGDFERVNGTLPEMDLCKNMKSLPDPPLVIVYTNRNSFADIAAFILSGSDHYVHKSTDQKQLVETGKRILAGESAWLLGLDQGESSKRLLAAAKVNRLTCRERQVLGLLLRRYSNRQIAKSLHISLQTTKNHVSHILRKLDCGKRSDLFTS